MTEIQRSRISLAILVFVSCLIQQACDSQPSGNARHATAITPDSCAALAEKTIDDGRVESAVFNASGTFDIPKPGPYLPPRLEDLPDFCDVSLVIAPTAGSRIGVQAWLPTTWNGRLLMVGNGGYSSAIAYHAFAEGVRDGYAMIGTDTGHEGDDPEFGRDRPESIVDWAWRSVHEAATKGSALVAGAYGRPANYRYFAGCSTGGHQALMEAQRFPGDFDGIIVGAPGHNRTHLNAGFLWQFLKNHEQDPPHAEILPASKLQLLNRAVLAQCGEDNGATAGGLADDSWLNDPFACDFDPVVLQCDARPDADCLTASEVDAARSLYAGPTNPVTGERIYFGQLPGSELAGGPPDRPGWSLYWADPTSPRVPARTSFWKYWVFQSDAWDWWQFDFNIDTQITDSRLAGIVNAMNPDLRSFRRGGGKLLHYHGLSDAVVPASDSVDYFERVRQQSGGDSSDFYRLFLAPGVHHCFGGPGANHFDMLEALIRWVEQAQPPDRIIATGHTGNEDGTTTQFERPLCPYPQRAVYDGSGDPASADSFECREINGAWRVPQLGQTYRR